MALQRVPTEIWQTILRYSISVPIFFEIDPIEACGFQDFVNLYTDTKIYWRSERCRNVFRRVCKNWDSYLLRFEDRFVDLGDVVKGVVPISAVQKAIRIQYGYGDIDLYEFLQPILGGDTESWSLEILHGGLQSIDKLIITSGKTPRLGSIAFSQDLDLGNITTCAPSLRFLDLLCDTPQSLKPLQLAQLTSISILIDPISPLLSSDLPSLKHLGLYVDGDDLLSVQTYIELLRTLGKNLITLFDYSAPSTEFLPHTVWALCPNLKRFKTYLTWPEDASIPQSLDSLAISRDILDKFSSNKDSYIPVTALQKAGNTSVTMDKAWTEGLVGFNTTELMDYTAYLIGYGISFYDVVGVKFQDFMVALLRHRKANVRKVAPYWNATYRVF